eukprot:CCRYP_018291-RA/>CCRYP_018291-RA protein AED:0.00 eAED:0.00 QI:119/1/1/1/0/0/2/691/645
MKWRFVCAFTILVNTGGAQCGIIATCAAFEFRAPRQANFLLVRPRRRLHGSTPTAKSHSIASSSSLMSHQSSVEDPSQAQKECDHPHTRLWSSALNKSPNSHVHPSIELVIRPPSEGGTGIVAINDIPVNTIVMSLRLEEVGMIDATSMIKSYKLHAKQDDAVFNMLVEMWETGSRPINNTRDKTQEGQRLLVLSGIVAHLQIVRYKDLSSSVTSEVKAGFALDESRRLGAFLDAMPLLLQHVRKGDRHPFPTHFLFWTGEEVENLLQGTVAQALAYRDRAIVTLTVPEWSNAFLEEHSSSVSKSEILNAIYSSFACVTSRSFGVPKRIDLDGKGLIPVVDMLNHDSENANVQWKFRTRTEERNNMIPEGKDDFVVRTIRDVLKGQELVASYGWRPSWDMASSYGFVPRMMKERWECSAIPLFPAVLDLDPYAMSSQQNKTLDKAKLDLLSEANYGPLVKAVTAAVDATLDKFSSPNRRNRIQILSVFRPPSPETSPTNTVLRRQPVVVVETKIHNGKDSDNQHHHKLAIKSILPAFRAAAAAISQLRHNHQKGSSSPIKSSQMALAAASNDGGKDWDAPALALIRDGINDRITALLQGGQNAEMWLAEVSDINSSDHRQHRANLARATRDAELRVLEKLLSELS